MRFSSDFIDYIETFVSGLKIGFRGVIFPGSGCIYLKTVQYGCFCLKIPEIVADIYIGTVQKSVGKSVWLRAYKISRTHMDFF